MDKLGVKDDSKISVIHIQDDAFMKELKGRAKQISVGKPSKDSDLIFFEANSVNELMRLKTLRNSIKPNGAIWVVSLKGKQATIKDVDVIAAAKSAGLVDNKVVGFSETHTSLRLVIPLNRR